MLDIGPGEFIALAIIAMIVLGPEKLPRYAAEAARFLGRMRTMANSARADVRRELGPEFDDINLGDLNPKTMVRRHLLDPIDLDSLDPMGENGEGRNRSRNGRPTKPAGRRGPGDPPSAAGSGDAGEAAAAPPPPYDPDTT